jgi:hypothetical protein
LIRDVQSVVFLSPFSLEIHVFLIVRSLYRSELYIRKKSEDTKGVIRIRKSKKDRQHNCQKKKDKRTNNDLQNIHIKLKIE